MDDCVVDKRQLPAAQCAVRIEPRDERIGRAELLHHLAADQRLQMNHLIGREQVLLIETEM